MDAKDVIIPSVVDAHDPMDDIDFGFNDEPEVITDVVDDDGSDDIYADGEASDADTPTDTEGKFILDGIDLTHIPEELRKETLVDTIKAIEEDRTAKAKLATEKDTELGTVKGLLKQEGFNDSFTAQYHKNLANLDSEISTKMKEARAFLQSKVNTDQMSEAEANLQYGEFKAELKAIRENFSVEEYNKTNLAIVNNFYETNKEVFANEHIKNAAESMLTDIIKDGGIIDTERSMGYLKMGKGLFDEGFKQGLVAAKQQLENEKLNQTKQKATNTQVTKTNGAGTQKGAFRWESSADVPQRIWNKPENEALRQFYIRKESGML